MHGLLSLHCSYRISLKLMDKVELLKDCPVYNSFEDKPAIDKYLENWLIFEKISDEKSGYLGIIYENKVSKQFVLAHRSTQLNASLLQPGLKQDIEGVVMGGITAHQCHSYKATEKAVKYCKDYRDYSLSFTGHSLGSWLAELSVLYCHKFLDFKRVKAVTFDGPGSNEMMEKLCKNKIEKFDFENLNIVAYLSKPNLVNCTNSHKNVRNVYQIFPLLTSSVKDSYLQEQGNLFKNNVVKALIPDWLSCNVGHDLRFILPLFDSKLGIPNLRKKVSAWPLIEYEVSALGQDSLVRKGLEIT